MTDRTQAMTETQIPSQPISERLEYRAAHLGDEDAADAFEEIASLRSQLEESRKLCTAFEEAVGEDVGAILTLKARIAELEENERAYEEIIGKKTFQEVADRIRDLEQVVGWVDSWVSNPVGAYSVHALDGLFRTTREKIEALRPTDTAP